MILSGGAGVEVPESRACSRLGSDPGMRAGYPEAYFGRLALPAEAVMAVVAACRSDDVYHQVYLLHAQAC